MHHSKLFIFQTLKSYAFALGTQSDACLITALILYAMHTLLLPNNRHKWHLRHNLNCDLHRRSWLCLLLLRQQPRQRQQREGDDRGRRPKSNVG